MYEGSGKDRLECTQSNSPNDGETASKVDDDWLLDVSGFEAKPVVPWDCVTVIVIIVALYSYATGNECVLTR